MHKVIQAAYGAFRSGLDVALLAAGAAMIFGAVIAVATLHRGDDGLADRARAELNVSRRWQDQAGNGRPGSA